MRGQTIETELRDGVGLIRFNRPDALNALNPAVLRDVAAAMGEFESNPAVGAMVITGDDQAFAAGADIKEMAEASAVEMLAADTIAGYDRIRAAQKPLIAAVSGWCLGGGNEVALSCDLIIASETAKFGQPEINLGIIPGAGGTQLLTKAVGKALAMEMVLNNRMLSAQEALAFGLINAVHPPDSYLKEALKIAAQIAARAPIAIRMAKEMVKRSFETPLSTGIAEERQAFYFLFSTADQAEGMQAFIEKRDPEWQGK